MMNLLGYKLNHWIIERSNNIHFSNDPISFNSIKLCNNRINYSSQIPGQLLITLTKIHHGRKKKFVNNCCQDFNFL